MEVFAHTIDKNTTCYMQDPKTNEEIIIDNIDDWTVPDSVKKLLKKVRTQILEYDSPVKFLKIERKNKIIVDDIRHIFVKKYMYRRGTVLLGLQKSTLGKKILYYYTKTIHHNGQCFHTTPDIKIIEKLKKELQDDKELKELIEYVFKYVL